MTEPFLVRSIFAALSAICGILMLVVCRWYSRNFYSEFEEIYITVTSPLQGTDTTVIKNGFDACFIPVFSLSALFIAAEIVCLKLNIFTCKTVAADAFLLFGLLLAAIGLVYANSIFKATEYISLKLQTTDIYEKHYTNPESVTVAPTGKKKNLIYLYVESLETSYADTASGGKQSCNYIPNLTQLAREETNFSENGLLGGFHSTFGSCWTSGGLFSSTAGIPYSTCFRRRDGKFAPNASTLYDILDKEGYNQYFICGSDAHFGGRSDYYKSHGDITIFDYNTAKTDGYIPQDYRVWWGLEDEKLYAMAKDKILAAAKKDEPFSFTMLTVDTHFPKGYTCRLCGNEHENKSANIIKCADRQAAEFIDWCKKQDFYKNTVVVVAGDHPRMDIIFPAEMTQYERTTYLAIVNSAVNQDRTRLRCYTQMDIFPTVLGAMGYQIDGDRLGFGTNLFSKTPTLAENMGFEKLNAEMAKRTKFVKKFW